MSRNADHRRHAGGRLPALLLAVAATLAAPTVVARPSDRRQPMDIEAGRQVGTFSGDSVNTLSGGVHITQGSLDITSDTARITLANSDPTRAVFGGGPVVLKQVMDDGTPMTARANGVDYNLKTEIVVFTGSVHIQQPRGSMSGERVVYNLKTGSIDSGGEGGGRVKMRILPRNAQAAPAPGTAPEDKDGN
jgi:lipopolysaccharide export system protein LptA